MKLDYWPFEGRQSIVEGPGVMGESTGVYDDRCGAASSGVDDIDEFAFVVGLMVLDHQAELRGCGLGGANVVIERGIPVYLGFALPQQTEIRPGQQKDQRPWGHG